MENIPEENKSSIEKRKSKLKNFCLGWIKDNYDKIFVAVIILAFIIRLWIFLKTMNQPFWWDEADYLSAAKRWGLGLDIRDIWYYRRGFLFPLIGALFFKLGLGEIGIRFLMVLFSAGIVVVSYFIIAKMFNKKAALLTSIALSLSWIMLFFTGRVLTDIPAAFFILLSLLFFWKGYVFKEGNKFLYLFGLFFGIAVLTRMQSLVFALPFLIYIIIKEKSKLFKNKHLWMTLGIFVLLLLPQVIMYTNHYGNPIQDILGHYFGVKNVAADASSYSETTISTLFNYFADLPYILGGQYPVGQIVFFLFLMGVFVFFLDLFLGFDKIFKNEEIQKKLFIFLWIVVPFLVLGYITVYVEQRYVSADLIFLFFMVISLIISIGDYLVKHFNLSKKTVAGAVFILVIALMIPNLIFANSLVGQKVTSYSEVKQVGELIKADSNAQDIILSTSLPQITYYSERSTYPYDLKNAGISKEESFLANYSDGEAGLNEFIKNKKPKYIMASIFEVEPEWLLKKGTYQNNNYLILPFFNSSMSYNSQGQIVSLDLKEEVKKGGATLRLFYPTTQQEINGIFIYKVDYS